MLKKKGIKQGLVVVLITESVQISRVSSRVRWLNGEKTKVSRPSLFSLGEMNTLDFGPRHIFTCPNRLLKVSREPMIASGQSQMRAPLSPVS